MCVGGGGGGEGGACVCVWGGVDKYKKQYIL